MEVCEDIKRSKVKSIKLKVLENLHLFWTLDFGLNSVALEGLIKYA